MNKYIPLIGFTPHFGAMPHKVVPFPLAPSLVTYALCVRLTASFLWVFSLDR